ncbi:MAG: pantetheine-phosphate adenylyltransferase [Phenylobacterium sp.]|uniref:pantetheine-phosphate adenylyltransferase n=1 Tax=Phenylobacterium sp. TaxID=1871053 RepID=UPI002737065F|nr:pantetheine-phosphate adenylyltransferase [Phenylobacterium sp.]MDP3174449.1 pantetheine-phosphate adenylyltransferase [Phenylobacterium sp.]
MSRVGLYPGTFDPFTNGHTDIIGRAVKLVDKLVIGVARNEGKGPLFTLEERVAIIVAECEAIGAGDKIVVQPFSGLLIHYAREVGADIIVRGLRTSADFEYEFQMTAMNQQLDREVETVFLMADPKHQAISSSLVKVIAQLGGDVSKFVSTRVTDRLAAKAAAR